MNGKYIGKGLIKAEIDMAVIFCSQCGESNDIEPSFYALLRWQKCTSCDSVLVTSNDDYCCLCGCEQ